MQAEVFGPSPSGRIVQGSSLPSPFSPTPSHQSTLPHPLPASPAQRTLARSAPLSSLPPHRRAQVLLQEIAGLTSRLGGNKAWHHTPFLAGATVPPEAAAATTTKEVLSLIGSHQALLFDAIGEMMELQEIDQEKQGIAESVTAKDAALRDFAKRLRDAAQVLEYTIEDYEDYRKKRKTCLSSQSGGIGIGTTIDVKEIIAYAHRISYTTFAPPEFASGQIPLRGAFPPAPQDEQMRASQLYHVSDLDIGLPKPSVAATTPLIGVTDAQVELGRRVIAEDNSQVPATLRAAGIFAPSIPPGWRPGMPIELPVDLPPMPPGWKPGDPIPLLSGLDIPLPPPGWKPGDVIVLPPVSAPVSRPTEQAMPSKSTVLAANVPVPPPGVIQVPFVQLDLNPELEEDYGSDYSDEDGSSEEDDD